MLVLRAPVNTGIKFIHTQRKAEENFVYLVLLYHKGLILKEIYCLTIISF